MNKILALLLLSFLPLMAVAKPQFYGEITTGFRNESVGDFENQDDLTSDPTEFQKVLNKHFGGLYNQSAYTDIFFGIKSDPDLSQIVGFVWQVETSVSLNKAIHLAKLADDAMPLRLKKGFIGFKGEGNRGALFVGRMDGLLNQLLNDSLRHHLDIQDGSIINRHEEPAGTFVRYDFPTFENCDATIAYAKNNLPFLTEKSNDISNQFAARLYDKNHRIYTAYGLLNKPHAYAKTVFVDDKDGVGAWQNIDQDGSVHYLEIGYNTNNDGFFALLAGQRSRTNSTWGPFPSHLGDLDLTHFYKPDIATVKPVKATIYADKIKEIRESCLVDAATIYATNGFEANELAVTIGYAFPRLVAKIELIHGANLKNASGASLYTITKEPIPLVQGDADIIDEGRSFGECKPRVYGIHDPTKAQCTLVGYESGFPDDPDTPEDEQRMFAAQRVDEIANTGYDQAIFGLAYQLSTNITASGSLSLVRLGKDLMVKNYIKSDIYKTYKAGLTYRF